MDTVTLLQDLATETWTRLRVGQILQARLGEEGLTDLLLLEIMVQQTIAATSSVVIVTAKTKKSLEKKYGTDWEWWIGNPAQGWIRYAIQAKLLHIATQRYATLGHKVGPSLQVDILESYAAAVGAIPLYCLYNYSPASSKAQWNCCEARDEPQLGCSVTGSSTVRAGLATRGARTFLSLHANSQTVPWRCLVKCGRYTNTAAHPMAPAGTAFWQRETPRFYARKTIEIDTEPQEAVRELWPNDLFPRRILVTIAPLNGQRDG